MTHENHPFILARMRAANERPYFCAALYALSFNPRPGLGTVACDQHWRIYYDPQVVARWFAEKNGVVKLAGVLLHELNHLLRAHYLRSKAIGALEPWANLAQDASINDSLFNEGVILPVEPVTTSSLRLKRGLTWEEYYKQLKKEPETATGEGSKLGNEDDIANVGRSSRRRSSASGARDRPNIASLGLGAGKCGSCASGHKESYEDSDPSTNQRGNDDGEASGLSEFDAELVRRQVAEAIREQHASGRGHVPGEWVRWAGAILQPRVDWRRELSATVRRAVGETSGASDYSYRHHARRQSLYPDFVIPALRRPVPEVAVLIDTSGSMSEKMLAQAVAEVGGVLRQLGMRHTITVLSVDAAVHTCQRVFSATQIQLVGGGGTDLRKGFKKVCEMHSKPQILIVLTDGETPWPETAPPGIRTIIVLLGTGLTPRWARVVKIATNDN